MQIQETTSINENDPFLLEHSHAAELLLIRHAHAIPDADEIIPNGVYNNLPLSKKGRAQALALAERLKDLHFDAVYSSPLRRCQETAAPLLAQLNLTPIIVEDLKEVRLRVTQTIPVIHEGDDLQQLTDTIHTIQMANSNRAAITGSWDGMLENDTSHAFRARVVTAIDNIAHQHIGERVLIFSHGGVINAYAAEVLGLDRDFFFPSANTAITIVRASGTQRVLYTMNDIAHLHR
ncbi:MAG: histidine phosphatase family protein [Ktedonobacteraceae bacterium]|nr:histidine phosphatase family protein [Ktedonobacteraceae bacterium]